MILKFADLSQVFLEILNIFIVHLLLSFLELLHSDDFVVAYLFRDLANQLDKLVGLFDRQKDIAVLSEIPELLTALFEFFKKETQFPEVQLGEAVLEACLDSWVEGVEERFHLV